LASKFFFFIRSVRGGALTELKLEAQSQCVQFHTPIVMQELGRHRYYAIAMSMTGAI